MTAPLVPLPILATRAVVVPKAAVILQSIVAIAWLYALTMYFQGVLSNVPLTIAGSTGTGDKAAAHRPA